MIPLVSIVTQNAVLRWKPSLCSAFLHTGKK